MFQVVAAPARAIDTNNNLSLLPNGKKRQYNFLGSEGGGGCQGYTLQFDQYPSPLSLSLIVHH